MSGLRALGPPRGMDDLLPDDFALKHRVVEVIREVFKLFGYLEVETPTVEYYELFAAKSGEEIRERMFDFRDKAGRHLVLRPEVTASIARLMSTKLKAAPLPIRLGYIADCYRYDEPQWGRKRRFWQGGFELFGSRSPLADAEILQASYEVFVRLGMKDHFFRVGHVGILRSILTDYNVEESVQDRILTMIDRGMEAEAFNAMRENGVDEDGVKAVEELIRLKGEERGEIFSKASDILSPWREAGKHLEELNTIIDSAVEYGVNSKIIVEPGMARGLEYYTGFIFEQGVPEADVSLNGGGRYDKLVELFGGKPTPGVGCAIGITRITHYLSEKRGVRQRAKRPCTLLVGIQASERYISRVAGTLRRMGIPIEVEVTGKRLPAAIEYALKSGIKYLVIVGSREESRNTASVRDLERKTQVEVSLDEGRRLAEMLGERIC